MTREAVDAVASIVEIIERFNDISTAVAGAVEEQDVVTREIAQSATQAADATEETSHSIKAVSGNAARTDGAANKVLSTSAILSEQSGILRKEADKFLSYLRVS